MELSNALLLACIFEGINMVDLVTVFLAIATIVLAIATIVLARESKKHRQGDLITRYREIFYTPKMIQINSDFVTPTALSKEDKRYYLNFFDHVSFLWSQKVLEFDFIDETFGQYIKSIFDLQNDVLINYIKDAQKSNERSFEILIKLYHEICKRENKKPILW